MEGKNPPKHDAVRPPRKGFGMRDYCGNMAGRKCSGGEGQGGHSQKPLKSFPELRVWPRGAAAHPTPGKHREGISVPVGWTGPGLAAGAGQQSRAVYTTVLWVNTEQPKFSSWVQPPLLLSAPEPQSPSPESQDSRTPQPMAPSALPAAISHGGFVCAPAPENAEVCLEIFGFGFDKILMISAPSSLSVLAAMRREVEKKKRFFLKIWGLSSHPAWDSTPGEGKAKLWAASLSCQPD